MEPQWFRLRLIREGRFAGQWSAKLVGSRVIYGVGRKPEEAIASARNKVFRKRKKKGEKN